MVQTIDNGEKRSKRKETRLQSPPVLLFKNNTTFLSR